MSSYDAIPYESLPISYTYLPHLAGLGRLFGLHTTNPEQCRVLDIGCAEGHNIIPMAWYWRKSEFVGIDLSEVQIKTGQKMIDALSLTNIQLFADDINHLDTTHLGKFDYILIHGVFSWIPQDSQHTLLKTAHAMLNEKGIIYISYNTYPGWHAQMTIRDAMRLYCINEDSNPNQVIEKIPKALHYFKGFFKAADNEFSRYHSKRLAALEQHSNQYLYHEFLEDHNHPLYITDFINKAEEHDLQYLSDALLTFDNPLILGQQRHKLLKKIKDPTRKLQYMDFMINQRFRRSLLCHNKPSIRHAFAPEHMVGLAYRGNLSSLKSVSLHNEKPARFYQDLSKNGDTDTYITLAHPVSKAAVQILADAFPSSIDYMDLLTLSCQRVADAGGFKYVKNIEPYYQEFYLLLINDWISTDITPHTTDKTDEHKPMTISDLSWQYAKHHHFLPTRLQKAIDIDELGMRALELLKKGVLIEELLKMIELENKDKTSFLAFNTRKNAKKQLTLFLKILNKNGLLYNT